MIDSQETLFPREAILSRKDKPLKELCEVVWRTPIGLVHCVNTWGVSFQAYRLAPDIYEAVFGYNPLSVDWHNRSEFKNVCGKHYRWIQKKDGLDIGYRAVGGKLYAYVKNVGF